MRAGIILFSTAALLGSATLTASAAEPGPGPAKLTPKAAAAVKKFKAEKGKKRAPMMSGVKAAKDGDSGNLRPLSAEEDAAIASKGASATTVRVNADGSLTAVLGEEFMSDLVVEKHADGSLETSCGQHGHGAAKPALETK